MSAPSPIPGARRSRDRAVLAVCAFFVAAALTIELWWLRHAADLPGESGWLGAAFRFYGRGDRGYYDQVSGFEIGLETFHVYVTTFGYAALIVSVLTGTAWRMPLQLCLGAYVAYSVVIYFAGKHLLGYAQMPVHDIPSFLIFYLPNLPWLFGSLFLAFDAGLEITRAVARREAAP